jgi:hypothetical protein
MHGAQIPRHTGDIDLSWDQARDALGKFEGSRVTVRVVERSEPETLVAVFEGDLGVLGHEKQPALFWPVRSSGGRMETPGFYMHPDRFEGAVARAGGGVLVIVQGPVLINVRQS